MIDAKRVYFKLTLFYRLKGN